MNDKEIKRMFKEKASKDPDKYYATSVLKQEGFIRKKCKKCGTYFWTTNPDQEVCGDPSCSGGYRFINDSPARNKLSYVEVWKRFSKFFEKRGYTPIKPYPVVARWRDDTDFVQASIYDFQPWVVSGEVDPPANPLVVPQFCLRFNDIENVGVTGAHYTGFIMIGQHAFMPPERYDQEKYFRDIYEWLTQGLGIPKEEITFHEDAWAGGGNFGPSMEFFSRGLEVGNQVYMQFAVTSNGYKELKTKVLDMGMGHERNAWFSNGSATSYEVVMPNAINYLKKVTNTEIDQEFLSKFTRYSSLLNRDEVKNLNEAWRKVSQALGMNEKELREKIGRISAIYSIADHTRSLLIAINDGALPSNVGGGYNLRLILRRALSLAKRYRWIIDYHKLAEMHVKDLKGIYQEEIDVDHFHKIFSIEKKRYESTLERNRKIIRKELNRDINSERLLMLYESYGINPEEVKRIAQEEGKSFEIPNEFYELLQEKREKSRKSKEKKQEILNIDEPETIILYYDHYDYLRFEARILKVMGNKLLLDRTAFYPTSGGQDHDTGKIIKDKEEVRVIDVYKQGKYVIHVLEREVEWKKGEMIYGEIDADRRIRLTQHHTATHILNGAARNVLGKHVWQAGAEKTVSKARLDITHYEALTRQEIKEIERVANEVVMKNLPVYKYFLKRNIAEQRFGIRIYQGGAVPGKELRIVEIPDFDVEACGGTHLNTSGEVRLLKIKKTTRIQDGIVRIEFVAGDTAIDEMAKAEEQVKRIAELLDCKPKQIVGRVEELFQKWKKARKKKLQEFKWESSEEMDLDYMDLLQEAAQKIKTQPEHLEKTINRFLNDIKKVINK